MSELNEHPSHIKTLKQELSTAKTYQHNLPDEGSVGAIWLLSLMCLLMRIVFSFLHVRYTGYLNIIKDHKSHFYAAATTMAGALSVTPVHPSVRPYVLTYVRLSNDVRSLSRILLIRIL